LGLGWANFFGYHPHRKSGRFYHLNAFGYFKLVLIGKVGRRFARWKEVSLIPVGLGREPLKAMPFAFFGLFFGLLKTIGHWRPKESDRSETGNYAPRGVDLWDFITLIYFGLFFNPLA